MDLTTLKPIRNRVLLKVVKAEDEFKNSSSLLHTLDESTPNFIKATVLKIGSTVTSVHPGDTVLLKGKMLAAAPNMKHLLATEEEIEAVCGDSGIDDADTSFD